MTFPPEVQAVMDRLAVMTNDEADLLAEAWSSEIGYQDAWAEAFDASIMFFAENDLSEILVTALYVARTQNWSETGGATWNAIRDVILAYLPGNAITAEQSNLLAGPWKKVIG